MVQIDKEKINDSDEVSASDIITAIKSGVRYIRLKWKIILISSIVGGILGVCYSIFEKPTYSAVCTFVLEDNDKVGALSQYSGLASLAGIDLGGSNGLFHGDNIIELYKSRLMLEQTLLSEADFNGKNQLLIERYINFNKLRAKWKSRNDIDSITFYGDPGTFTRQQDSIITDIVDAFNKRNLTVEKPDKKMSIINVGFSSKDESFAREFTNKLVETVNNFYIQTKTKKSYQNVQILQHQADSVKQVLNTSISGVASAIDAAPNANPLLLSLRVPSQKRQVDVQASAAVYGEIVKNLELSKISLREEKPLIQIIDKPVLPLDKTHIGKIKGFILGCIAGFFLTILTFVIMALYKRLISLS